MKKIYLEMWDSTISDNEYHLKVINSVIGSVEQFGEASVIFKNESSNRRDIAFKMAIMLPKHYNVVIKRDQSLKISKS